MKSFCRITGLFALFASGLLLPSVTRADMEAVTNQVQGSLPGFFQGGVGFSFTPLTNVLVTRVGYEDRGAINPVIRVWLGTNTLLETYSLPQGFNSGQVISSNVSLALTAGQEYFITLQDPAQEVVVPRASFNFQTADLLTNYTSCQISTNGVFGAFAPGLYYSGVNFSFQTGGLPPIVQPLLSIRLADPDTVLVSWPEPAPGFVLQDSTDLSQGNWNPVTNAVEAVNGTNQVTLSPRMENQFFRLLHP